jgi:uncharacterized hydrophobic protein (TIGR00271 family)
MSTAWTSPSFLKGAAFAVAGLAVLAVPEASLNLLRFTLAAVLMVSGGIAYWGRLWHRTGDMSMARAVLSMAAGVGLLVAPISTIRAVELVLAAYLAAQAALAVIQLAAHRQKGKDSSVQLVRSLFLFVLAALLLLLPKEAVGLVVVALALAAVFVGLIMVAWALRHGSQKPDIASRAQAIEVLWHWLSDRDVGRDRRIAIADTLYFEPPHRRAKLVSYVTMLLLSTALASLAILQDSTAVVIGAMLVAPLMTPIMGCAVALVAGWRRHVLRSLGIVAASAAACIGLAWILASWIPALVPLEANSQVLSRGSPTLLDMAVALAAGAAGAYATLDDRVSSSLTGVAIAVALVPPLGVVGICLQAGLWSDAGGAFLLFATNLVSIIVSSSLVFILFGFAPVRTREQMQLTNTDVIASVAIVALLIMVPLGLTGQNVLKSINHAHVAQARVADWLGEDSGLRLLRVKVKGHVVDVQVSGSGDVPDISSLERVLSKRLGVDVEVRVELFPSVVLTSGKQGGAPDNKVGQSAQGVDDRGGETGREGDEDGALE